MGPRWFPPLLLSSKCSGANAHAPVHGWPAPTDEKRARNHQREGFGWSESELPGSFVDGGSEGCGCHVSERVTASQALGAWMM